MNRTRANIAAPGLSANMDMVARLPTRQKNVRNRFFDAEKSEIAPNTGARTKTITAARLTPYPQSEVADRRMPAMSNPCSGTRAAAKYAGKTPTATVVT